MTVLTLVMIGAPILTWIGLSCLQKGAVRNSLDAEKFDLRELLEKFKTFERVYQLFLGVTIIGALLVICFYFPVLQKKIVEGGNQDIVYYTGVPWFGFLVPGFFVGLIIPGYVVEYIAIIVGRKCADSFEEFDAYYSNLQKRWGGGKEYNMEQVNAFALIIAAVSVIALLNCCNNYFYVTDSQIVHRRYLSLRENKFSYSAVKKILLIKRYQNRLTGALAQAEPCYSIVVNDGYKIETLNFGINGTFEEKNMANYISEKSGVSIREGVRNVDDI